MINLHLIFNKQIPFDQTFTALLFFPLVGWWLANHKVSYEKVFVLLR